MLRVIINYSVAYSQKSELRSLQSVSAVHIYDLDTFVDI